MEEIHFERSILFDVEDCPNDCVDCADAADCQNCSECNGNMEELETEDELLED